MNKDELKGKAENLKGRAKQAAGTMTGNKRTEGEGVIDRLKGGVREKAGQAKDEASRDVSHPEDEDE
jgi:uncharacterized protein YjbJ (UPF0337 family)